VVEFEDEEGEEGSEGEAEGHDLAAFLAPLERLEGGGVGVSVSVESADVAEAVRGDGGNNGDAEERRDERDAAVVLREDQPAWPIFELPEVQLDEPIDSSLHTAAEHGKVWAVDALLEAGIDVDEMDEYGRTPLMYAAEAGHLNVMRRLLAAGASVGITDEFAVRTVLHLAARRGRSEAIKLLLEACPWEPGSNDFLDFVEARDKDQLTALFLARQCNAGEAAFLELLRAGARLASDGCISARKPTASAAALPSLTLGARSVPAQRPVLRSPALAQNS